MALPSSSLLLRNDPVLIRHSVIGSPALLLGPPTANPYLRVMRHAKRLRSGKALRRGPSGQDQKVFLRLCTIRVIDQEPTTEAGAHSGGGEQLDLGGILWIKLQDGPGAPPERGIEGGEEDVEPLPGVMFGAVGIAQPLDGGDGHGAVEGAHAERDAVTGVGEQKVAGDVVVQGTLQHVRRDVRADPVVPRRRQHRPRQTRARADVQQQRRGRRRQR